MSSSQNYNHHL